MVGFLTPELPWFFPLPNLIVPFLVDQMSPGLAWDEFAGNRKRVDYTSEPGGPGLVSSSTGAPVFQTLPPFSLQPPSACGFCPRGHTVVTAAVTAAITATSHGGETRNREGGSEGHCQHSQTLKISPRIPTQWTSIYTHLPWQMSPAQPWCLGKLRSDSPTLRASRLLRSSPQHDMLPTTPFCSD